MEAVTIHDTSPHRVLSFDLADLLRLAGPPARTSTWRCSGVEAIGDAARLLHAAADDDLPLAGDDLIDIAAGVSQVIDGDFFATRPGEATPWLVIRAIDSSFYVVVTDDQELLGRIRATFRDVRDSPEDAEVL